MGITFACSVKQRSMGFTFAFVGTVPCLVLVASLYHHPPATPCLSIPTYISMMILEIEYCKGFVTHISPFSKMLLTNLKYIFNMPLGYGRIVHGVPKRKEC